MVMISHFFPLLLMIISKLILGEITCNLIKNFKKYEDTFKPKRKALSGNIVA